MRTNNIIKTFNTLLILLGIALIAVSYPKLFMSERNFSVSEEGLPIGKILTIQNDARLKKAFLFNWDSLSNAERPIHDNDLIFTNDSSQAVFELGAGQKITIKSQTLLKLKNKALEVKNGALELSLSDNSKALKIMVGDREFSLTSKLDSKVTVSSHKGESKFEVSQGEVQIKAPEATMTAKAGEEVKANSREISKSLSDVELVFPKNETVYLKPGESLRFKVKNAPAGSKILATNSETKAELQKPLEQEWTLAPGPYEWKALANGSTISHSAAFEVVQMADPPKLASPKHLEEVVFYDGAALVDFKWKSEHATLLQINDEFQNLFFSEPVQGARRSVEFFKEGTYEWKVKNSGLYLDSEWSAPRTLIIQRVDYEKGEPVVISLERPDQLAEFSWESEGVSNSRKFVLSKSPDFRNIVHEKEVLNESFVKIPVAQVGIYYWKIVNQNGSTSRFIPKKVIIKPTPAPLKPDSLPELEIKLRPKKQSAGFFSFFPLAHAAEFEPINVAFPEIKSAKLYEIEIYTDKNLQNKLDVVQTKTPNFQWTPPRMGSYYWRIRYQDHWERWSPFSDPSSLAATIDSRFLKKKKPKAKVAKKPVSKPAKKKPVKPKALVLKRVQKKDPFSQSLSFSYAPGSVSYKDKAAQTVEVEGVALGGHAVHYQKKGDYPWFIKYQSSYGEVFEGENFSNRNLEAGAYYPLKGFSLGSSFLYQQISDYEAQASSVVQAGEIGSVGLGILFKAQINLGAPRPLNLEASAHFLQLARTAITLSYDFYFKKRIYLETKLKAEFLSLENGESEITSQSFQAFIGPKYLF